MEVFFSSQIFKEMEVQKLKQCVNFNAGFSAK